MQQLVRHWMLIIAVSGTVLMINLGGARLWDRDEPRNAGCAAEMMARGDWVTPVFNGELRIHKPVLLYWFMMTAYSVFGVNEFGARFWSAALGIGIALQTYTIGRRLFNPQVGLWAALILSTAVMFDVAGRAATPDSVFIFFTTLAMTVYVLGTFRPHHARDASASAAGANGKGTESLSTETPSAESRSAETPQPLRDGHWFPTHWGVVAVMYAVMGVATLAKGPVGLVIPTAVIGMFLLIMRLPAPSSDASSNTSGDANGSRTWRSWAWRLVMPFAPAHFLKTCWSMRPITAIVVVLLVSLPWYIWVGLRTDGDFIRGFLLEHNLGRTLRSMEGHGGPLFYYPAAIMLGFFPWSVFMLPLLVETVRRIRRRHPWTIGYILAACWVGVYVGLFSIARTKLPSYITPCYPGLALLAGGFIYHWSRGESLTARRWQWVPVCALGIVGLAILTAVPFVARMFLPGEGLLAAFGVIPVVGAIVCLILQARSRYQPAAITFAVTAFAFATVLFGWCTERVDRHRATEQLLAAVGADQHTEVGALGCLEPSWVFYTGKAIRELHLPRPGAEDPAAGRLNSKADSAKVPVKRPQLDVEQFLHSEPNRCVITTDRVLERWRQLPDRQELPDGIEVVAEMPYFLENERLLVLRRVNADAPRRTAAQSSAADGPTR